MGPENSSLCESDTIDINSCKIIEDSNIIPIEVHQEESMDLIEEVHRESKTRKRKSNPKCWKRNIRQRQCQAGESYTSSRGKVVSAKKIISKKDCSNSGTCKFQCEIKITRNERNELFQTFYSLNRQEKNNYILKMTTRTETERKTKKPRDSRRIYSFTYYVEVKGSRIQVCKPYWLGTFAISQKPVYDTHNKKNIVTGMRTKNRTEKSVKRIDEAKVKDVKDHITSFPTVESHYCRANSSKQYLDSNLNIAKMYQLYKDKYEDPVKESFYRHIFNTNFNLDFHRPKSDRCGKCETFTVAEKENLLTKEMKKERDDHLGLKVMMREQKALDKESGIPVLTFDLQNVLSCPRAEIGPIFYHSKLCTYNLTAQLSTTKKIYCAIWTEYTGGRSGNDIASALWKILEKVCEDNHITNLITWSDSCVPQNKNSIMTLAIQHFIKTHPEIENITMKYSLPGHSALQEVDNAHSQIEKCLSVNEYFSPIGLLRILKNVNRKNPFVIIQMKSSDFRNFSKYTKTCFDYKHVPFSSLKILNLKKVEHELEYSLDYKSESLKSVSIRKQAVKLRRNKNVFPNVPNVPVDIEPISEQRIISKEKSSHLISMFKYMGTADISYYKTILKIGM